MSTIMFMPPDNQDELEQANGVGDFSESPDEEIPEADIHTMPDKFLRPDSTPKKKAV